MTAYLMYTLKEKKKTRAKKDTIVLAILLYSLLGKFGQRIIKFLVLDTGLSHKVSLTMSRMQARVGFAIAAIQS